MLYEVNPWRPTVPMHGLHRFGQDQRQQRSERRAEGQWFASHLILKPACIQSTWAGTIMPSTILRRLATYSRKNKLYFAFRELGRVVRTTFLLQYISDLELRQVIQAT